MTEEKVKILPKIHYPIGIENEYKKILLAYNRSIKKDIRDAVVKGLNRTSLDNLYRTDAEDDLDFLLNAIGEKSIISGEKVKKAMRIIGLKIIDRNTKRLRNQMFGADVKIAEAFGVDIFADKLRGILGMSRAWASTNSRLITSIPVELLDDVARVINDGYRSGSTISYIQNQISTQFKVSDNRARLIARDQTAKLSGAIIKEESLALGYRYYVWVTSGDDRVRTSHRVMNGKVCDWLNPTIYKDYITDKKWKKRSSIGGVELDIEQDFQCRCSSRDIVNI